MKRASQSVFLAAVFACSSIGLLGLLGKKAPPVRTPQEAAFALRTAVNDKLCWFDRWVGFLTTPFKRRGIYGWTEYGLWACAAGGVEQVADSTDGLRTVDLRIASFTVNGQQPARAVGRYIRFEIFPGIRLERSELPHCGDAVRFCGKLMWDGDGWLEIHPQTRMDLGLPDP